MELTQKEKGVLLIAARDSISALFTNSPAPAIVYTFYPNLKKQAGAFVTLTIGKELRGCIGFIYSTNPLFETVCEAARLAATGDPRFLPLTQDEFNHTDIEISVLSPAIPISSYEEIKIGLHGLILEHGERRALLLPQVAIENNYTVPQFLNAICEKAGLPLYEWKEKKLNLKVFTAIVFSEAKNRKKTYVPN